MTASSYYSFPYQPAYGRLNFDTADGWCASTPSSDEDWLQVDLGQLYEVCGVATQGGSQYFNYDEWVTAFRLFYSQDGGTWTAYTNKTGNIVVRFFLECKLKKRKDDDDNLTLITMQVKQSGFP